MATLPKWIAESATDQLDWMLRFRPKVAVWLPDMLAQLDKLIQGIYWIQSGDVPLETAQCWLSDFVEWRGVYHSRLHQHFVAHVEPTLPEPEFSRSDAEALIHQSLTLVMDCQQVLNQGRSAMGTHAVAALISWQSTPSLPNLMKAMETTDRAMTDYWELIESRKAETRVER